MFLTLFSLALLTFSAAAEIGSIPVSSRRAAASNNSSAEQIIRLAGIFDLTTYDWGRDVFEVTVQLINEGVWGVLPPGNRLVYDLGNAKCDETTAAQAYWKFRTANSDSFLHGIIGCRCSGASVALARISGLEGVPQLSPASNAASLSNDVEFPFFSRLVAPNDEQGERTYST